MNEQFAKTLQDSLNAAKGAFGGGALVAVSDPHANFWVTNVVMPLICGILYPFLQKGSVILLDKFKKSNLFTKKK